MSFFYLGCMDKKDVPHNSMKEKLGFPTIIDTIDYEGRKVESDWLNTANYKLYYIGEEKDELIIDYLFNSRYLGPVYECYYFSKDTIFHEERIPYESYFMEWSSSSQNCLPVDYAKLEITIDINQLVYNDGGIAYPVIIKNVDSDSVFIAYGDFIPLIMEAMNEKGEWKPIEEPWIYMCGNGVGSVILPPNEIVLTSAFKYNGKHKTLMRLKIGENYSNTFLGMINPRQFESMFDEHG